MLAAAQPFRAIAAMTWQSSWLPAALIIGATALALVLVIYPRQLQPLPARWRWTLPALRAAGLVALALSLLRPVIVRPKTVQEQGAVLVLIDRSRSMSVRDFSADDPQTHAQLVALTDSLGRLPAGSRSSVAGLYATVQQLVAMTDEAINLRNELDFARISGRGADAAQSRLEAAMAALHSAIAAAREKSAELGATVTGDLGNLLKRLERGREGALQQLRDEADATAHRTLASQMSFDQRLYQRSLEVRGVCEQLSKLTRFQIAEAMLLDPRHGVLARLDARIPVAVFAFGADAAPLAIDSARPPLKLGIEPSAPATDLPAAIRSAIAQMGPRGVQGIIVLSDGRHTAGRAGSAAAPIGVPVLALPVASPTLRDLSILSARVPDAVFASEPFPVRLEARIAGLAIREIAGPVSLEIDGEPADSKVLSGRDDRLDPIEFNARVARGGVHRLDLVLPSLKAEATLQNNRVQRWVRVVGGRLRVSLLSGGGGWDWRYMRQALAQTPWIELHQELLIEPQARVQLGERQMADYDLLVINELSPASMSLDQRIALRRAVEERGAGLLLITVDPQVAEQWAVDPTLGPLLPYERGRAVWRTWPGENPTYRVQVAGGAETAEAVRLDSDLATSRRRWNELRPFFRFLALPSLRSGARALLIERDSRLPILTELPAGRGRAYMLCTNETWRWRQGIGGRDQDGFWRQLVRAAAAAPYAASENFVSLDADRVVAAPNQPIRVRARIAEEVGARDSMTVQVLREGQVVRLEELLPSGAGSENMFETTLRDLPAGTYELFAPDPNDDLALSGPRLPLRIFDDAEAEMADCSLDEASLRELAQATGGKLMSLGDMPALRQTLDDAASRQPQTVELPLWNSYHLYLFVLGCFAGEWALRKRFGLA